MSAKRPIKHKMYLDKGIGDWRTICVVQRELYRAIRDDMPKDKLLELVEESYDLGKRMHFKLAEYKDNYHQDIYERHGA
tara:strand:- start:337 stop:573 length:237 start_codon:yes stop_codon:yes gene_type:complete